MNYTSIGVRKKLPPWKKTRGTANGLVAVIASRKLGDGYATVMFDTSVDSLAAELPATCVIYAAIPSSDPDKVASKILPLWNDVDLRIAPYTMTSDGVVFHKATPDHLLCDIRTTTWELFAEQYRVEIVMRDGEKTLS